MADEDLLDKPLEQPELPAIEPKDEPEEDLRSTLSKAVAKQREQAEPSEAPEKPASEPKEKVAKEAGKSEQATDERPRDEQGRFVPKAGEQEIKPAEQARQEVEKPATETAQLLRPPPGWSVAAKAEFDKLPDPVKQAIANREAEVDNGFKRYGGLKQFADIAEKSGTTLSAAVSDYYKIETGLRQDFIGGVEAICQRFGVDPKSLAQVMAQKHGISARVGPQDEQQQQEQPKPTPQIDAQAIIRQAVEAARNEFGARETQSQIQAFSSDPANKFFENVKGDMAVLLQSGKASSLKDAYDQACWLNPETRAILLQEQIAAKMPKPQVDATQQARQAAKAVNGAPSPGFSPGADRGPDNRSLRDTIRDAVRAQAG